LSLHSRPLKWPAVFPLDKGLVAWYPFDDRSGSLLYDRSGKRNHGTIDGATWVAGRRGSALSFDGVNDYVGVPDSSSLDIVNYVTMAAWIKPSFAGDGYPYVASKGDDMYTLYLNKATKKAMFGFRRASDNAWGQVIGATPLTAGTWNHIVGLYDGTDMKIYVNGVLDETASRPGETIKTDNLNFYIGTLKGTSQPFDGIIDEVRIYNRALTAAEIKRLYESELMLVRH